MIVLRQLDAHIIIKHVKYLVDVLLMLNKQIWLAKAYPHNVQQIILIA